MNEIFRLYRGSGTDGATLLDLIIAVYDALAQDLNRAGESVASGDIEGRCKYSNHASLLLGYLEIWVEQLQEPELERSLSAFYSFLRAELLRLQTTSGSASFSRLAMMVCETRAAWQQKLNQVPTLPAAVPNLHSTAMPEEIPRMDFSA